MAAEHGAGGDLVAPRVADALGVPFLDRSLPASLAAASEESGRPGGLVGSLARASSVLAGEPVERTDLNEGHLRAELAAFLTRASTDGGVVLGRGGVVVLADAPGALHVLLVGDREGRVARVAEREGIDPDEADRRIGVHDRTRRAYVRSGIANVRASAGSSRTTRARAGSSCATTASWSAGPSTGLRART